MGLFSRDGGDIEIAESLFKFSCDHFNSISGAVNSVEASVNVDGVAQCCKAFERITAIGFPSDPGPFKRLAGVAVLSMQWATFDVRSIHSSSEHEFLQLIWLPRVALWSISALAPAMNLNGVPGFIQKLTLPTPHFQVEFVGYLRSMANGRETVGADISDSLLLERIIATGFVLEAAAYNHESPAPHAQAMHERASGCMDAIGQDEILQDDWRFNDPVFLEMAGGMGFD